MLQSTFQQSCGAVVQAEGRVLKLDLVRESRSQSVTLMHSDPQTGTFQLLHGIDNHSAYVS